MKRIAIAALATLALGVAIAVAQNVSNPLPPQSVNGAYNATPPTCTNANGCWLQTDINGNLKVVQSGSPTLPAGVAYTDRTITSASGASQQIMAANAARVYVLIENTGSANCGVNPLGGTAAIGGAGTFTLAPLGSFAPRVPPNTAITIICTAGQPIFAVEG